MIREHECCTIKLQGCCCWCKGRTWILHHKVAGLQLVSILGGGCFHGFAHSMFFVGRCFHNKWSSNVTSWTKTSGTAEESKWALTGHRRLKLNTSLTILNNPCTWQNMPLITLAPSRICLWQLWILLAKLFGLAQGQYRRRLCRIRLHCAWSKRCTPILIASRLPPIEIDVVYEKHIHIVNWNDAFTTNDLATLLQL